MDEDKKDLFARLGWRIGIVRLAALHIPFNLFPKRRVSGAKQFCDDYKMIHFFQST